MENSSVDKVNQARKSTGPQGQKYLASGETMSLRLWEKSANTSKKETRRGYETIGYVMEGRAELHIEGEVILLEKGDSWVVPKGATHFYQILEPFRAVEATSPPARFHSSEA